MALTTGKVRLSYAHVWQPYSAQAGQEPKYSVTILIPKSDVNTLNAIYAEMESVKQAGVSSAWGGNLPPIVKIPLYDGDGVRPSGEPFGEECKGHMVITASSKTQPQVVDLNVQPILNQADVYSGCYARVNINFFAYNQAGNKGLGCGLNCIQKIADGEPLAGGVSAQEAFGGSNAYQNGTTPMQGVPQGVTGGSYMPNAQQSPAPNAYGQAAQGFNPYQQLAQSFSPCGQPTQGFSPEIDPISGRPPVTGVMGI